MSTELAFVGDVHGNLDALRALNVELAARGNPHTVFLGDYINKGPHSSDVLHELLSQSAAGHATLLRGNHETAMLEALDSGDLTVFLKMGGAVTIRSYVGRWVEPDVLKQFRVSVPEEHLQAIRRMPHTLEFDDVIAQHVPSSAQTKKFRVSAHMPVGPLPRIRRLSAQLDTGCGSDGGRLTALLWPSLNYVQADSAGIVQI